MSDFGIYISIGFFMVLVIEGLLYALFPTQIQSIMKLASEMKNDKFRNFGAVMLVSGVLGIFLFQNFLNL